MASTFPHTSKPQARRVVSFKVVKIKHINQSLELLACPFWLQLYINSQSQSASHYISGHHNSEKKQLFNKCIKPYLESYNALPTPTDLPSSTGM